MEVGKKLVKKFGLWGGLGEVPDPTGGSKKRGSGLKNGRFGGSRPDFGRSGRFGGSRTGFPFTGN